MKISKIVLTLYIVGLSEGIFADNRLSMKNSSELNDPAEIMTGTNNITIADDANTHNTLSETLKVCNFLGDKINVVAHSLGKEKYVTTTGNIRLGPYDSIKGPKCGDLAFILPTRAFDITDPIIIKTFKANTNNTTLISEITIDHITRSNTANAQKQITISRILLNKGKAAYIYSSIQSGSGQIHHTQNLATYAPGTYQDLNGGRFAPDHIICFMYKGTNSAPCNTNTIYKQ